MRVLRTDAPIITGQDLPGDDGANINGPSLVRAPAWLQSPLGRYYLYFAHHAGRYIRLACADAVTGPWRVVPGGVLPLAQAPAGCRHIASPDVHVLDGERRLRMYLHGDPTRGAGQVTFVAHSDDGLHWSVDPRPLAPFYMRAFPHAGAWFGFVKGGDLYRSSDGIEPFDLVGNPFVRNPVNRPEFNGAGDIRHLAVDLRPDAMWVYHSRIGDAPERILRQRIDLAGDPAGWVAEPAEEVIRPTLPCDGIHLPVAPSRFGAAHGPEHGLRDPAILRDQDRTWLAFSIAAESGLAVAEILDDPGR